MTYRKRSVICNIAIMLGYLSTPAYVQSTEDDVERITTTQQRYQLVDTTSANALGIVTEQSLLEIAPTHIEEALRQIAGVGLQRGSGQEYLPALRSPVLTGAGACGAVLTSEDGIPIRAAGFCNNNELFEAHTEMAQRIDVIKGPATVVYGSNALHGTINVVTPDTTYDTSWLGVDIGSYGYKRFKGRYGKDMGSSGIGVNMSVTRDNGFRDEESVFQEKLNLRHRYDGDRLSFNSGVTYTHLDQQTAGYLTGENSYKSDVLINLNENPEAFRWAKALRMWSKIEWRNSSNQRFMVTPYFRNQDMQFIMHFLPGKPLEINNQQGGGVQSLWQYWNDDFQLTAGFDAEVTQGILKQFQDGPTKGLDFLRETIPAGTHYDYEVDAHTLAPFLQATQQWDKWTVSVGARYETMAYDYQTYAPPGRTKDNGDTCGFGGCRYSRPADTDIDFHRFSPKLSALYRATNQMELYASVAEGYRMPQATELFRLQRAQSLTDLSPESGLHKEVGAHLLFEDLSLNLAYYVLNKENVIYRNDEFFNVSDGETRHEGIELSMRWELHPGWTLRSAMTYAEHTYVHQGDRTQASIAGNAMDTAPRKMANTQLTWAPSMPLGVTLEWQHISQYFLDSENTQTYPGHDVLHVRTHYQINPQMVLRFRIYNLFDTRYAERADYTSFSGARYFPGQPRRFLLSAEFAW
ncbi:TonB-dependent receptor [Alteromonas ponticola]|uniref:TonB-dependent receptor n=1 Tax=Alteromonas aquimaris TaxID=2998417 RepID=A0ABT3P8M0_9ALTE|nr:TonB-dependent receptor [Alteromonas aquimaris]MCW8109117.1 TonB-dependent receptor [Alteromonas aquimaris]